MTDTGRTTSGTDERAGGSVGLWVGGLDAFSTPRLGEVVAEIEDLGYRALWFGEAFGREAFVNSAEILSSTTNLKVGTGIANIYARDAGAANAASKTLAEAHPGRFILGLGVSHRPMLEARGLGSSGSALSDMREFLEAMDESRYTGPEPEPAPPRVLAALGPKMLELSRDRADGAHPYLVTPKHTSSAREILGEGKLLIVEQAVVFSDDRERAYDLARGHLQMYLTLPNYRNSWLREGFTEEDFEDGGSERLVEGLVVWGSEANIQRRVGEHLEAGADQVLVQVVSDDNDALRRDWRRLAPALLQR